MGYFPGSSDTYKGRARIYGPLPTHGQTPCIVLHTTETRGMPGFNNGDTAPHYVYDAANRRWYTWAEYEAGYVGTMKGHNNGGHSNCGAFQVEIIAYSDGAAAGSAGLWVGDFTEAHYADLASFVRWARQRYGFTGDVTPTPAGGWRYGTSSPHRLTDSAYARFAGLTCHGAVPRNTHWDTGVLDLELIADLAAGGELPPPVEPPPTPTEGDTVYPFYETDGYDKPTGQGRKAKREDVRVLQGLTNDAGGDVSEDGKLGPATMTEIARLTGIAAQGTITGAHGNALRRKAYSGGGGGEIPPHSHAVQLSGLTDES